MNPYEVLMRGTAQFTGMIPGVNMSMPLNVRPDYIPGALVPSSRGSLVPPGPSSMATMGNQGGALVPANRGGLATMANQGAGYGPVNRVSVVDVTPQGYKALPRASGGGFNALGSLKGAGRLAGPAFEAYNAYQTGKEVFNPEDNILGSIKNLGTAVSNLFRSPEDQQAFTGNPNTPVTQRLNQKLNQRVNSATDNTTYSARPGFIGPVPQAGAAGQYGPPTPTNEPRRGAFTIDGFNPDITIDQYREQVIPSRKNLEDRAYQQEVSRVAQQNDPYFRSGAPLVNYSAEEGMAINRALYGDMLTPNTPNPLMAGLTYDQTNPTMQGKNYNMENPVGVQQSSAQSLADYYRNGMIEQQTQGMGSEPGLESVLSPEDRAMYLQQLSNFQPGGPG